ncbi:MAG: Gfo/Idh/MocA family oxidoreductase [Azospirillaceae bacterium]
MLGIGLIGCGRIGALHARTIAASPDCRLAVAFDTDTDRARALAEPAGAAVASTAEDVIADGRVDAVFICSPTNTHVPLGLAAIAADKPVFCEKPLDLDPRRAAEVPAALERRDLQFMVGFHRRFDPAHRRLKEAIEGGRLGAVETVLVVSRDPAPPPIGYVKASGGLFKDMAIHDLDMIAWLTGWTFEGVHARGAALVDPAIGRAGDIDTASMTLWDGHGRACTILNSRRSGIGFDQRVEAYGSVASATVENALDAPFALHDAGGRRGGPLPHHFPERYAAAYPAQLAAFVSAVRDGGPVPTTAADGLRALLLAEACGRSAWTGAPVAIDRSPETTSGSDHRERSI